MGIFFFHGLYRFHGYLSDLKRMPHVARFYEKDPEIQTLIYASREIPFERSHP